MSKRQKILLGAFCVVGFFLAIGMVSGGEEVPTTTSTAAVESTTTTTIPTIPPGPSLTSFESLITGVHTINDVNAAWGDGEVTAIYSIGDTTVRTLTWEGGFWLVSLTFEDGLLDSRFQYGLE